MLAISALPAFALAPGAFAQSASQPPATAPAAQSGAAPSGSASSGGSALSKSMSAKVETHIQDLRAELQITPSETSQWKQFAQVMRDNATQMEQAFTARSTNLQTMSAAQNMQSYAHLAQVHATNMQKLASTFQTLYNSFPQAQKAAADTVFRNRAHKMSATHGG